MRLESKRMKTELEILVSLYRELGIDKQIDYDKFYLYSLITHSTAIEGSTITELENQIMFDQGISLKGKSIVEQNMNLDLKSAYENAIKLANAHTDITVDLLKSLTALVMKNTGREYKTALGDFSSAQGDLRLLNVTAGVGGKSYMNYSKVPAKLEEFCIWVNFGRQDYAEKSMSWLYNLSFDAHYYLVTIHPWADGNGRMARLLMNMLQFEFGLIPTKILKDDKEEYIKALVETRENEDLGIFRKFMTSAMVKNLRHDIDVYCKSIDGDSASVELRLESGKKRLEYGKIEMESREKRLEEGKIDLGSGEKNRKDSAKGREKPQKSRKKIIALLSQDNTLSAAALARRIGITPKAVEKHIAKLKAEGVLHRIGPDKGGHWQVIEETE